MKKLHSQGIVLLELIIALVVILAVSVIGFLIFHRLAGTVQFPTKSITPGSGSFRLIKHIAYGPLPQQYLDAAIPTDNNGPTPIVIFVHGGGFTQGGTSGLYPEAEAVAKLGWVGISVNYRLNGYPIESNDVISAAIWVHNHASEVHADPNKIALFGTSAGGNLVAEAATMSREQHVNAGIVAVVSWSGPMDLASFAQVANSQEQATGKAYLGCSYNSCPSSYAAASPINHVMAGDPPMYLVNSTDEMIPYNQATNMVNKLRSFGNIAQLLTIQGNQHATQYASQAFQPSIKWLTQYLGSVHGALTQVPDAVAPGAES